MPSALQFKHDEHFFKSTSSWRPWPERYLLKFFQWERILWEKVKSLSSYINYPHRGKVHVLHNPEFRTPYRLNEVQKKN